MQFYNVFEPKRPTAILAQDQILQLASSSSAQDIMEILPNWTATQCNLMQCIKKPEMNLRGKGLVKQRVAEQCER